MWQGLKKRLWEYCFSRPFRVGVRLRNGFLWLAKGTGVCLQMYILDIFYHTRVWLLDALVWLAIRLTAYEVSFDNVRKKTTSNRKHTDLHLDKAADLDGLLAHSKAQVTEAVARRGIVTDKCKTIFTFNSALLALIAIFQGKTADLSSWEVVLFYCAVAAFVAALIVVWTYFDVGGDAINPLDQDLVELNKDNLKKSLINSNLSCATSFDNRTDYLVDLYRTCRFFLMVGFVFLLIVFSHNYLARGGGSDTDKMVERLKSDPKFQEVLRNAK